MVLAVIQIIRDFQWIESYLLHIEKIDACFGNYPATISKNAKHSVIKI